MRALCHDFRDFARVVKTVFSTAILMSSRVLKASAMAAVPSGVRLDFPIWKMGSRLLASFIRYALCLLFNSFMDVLLFIIIKGKAVHAYRIAFLNAEFFQLIQNTCIF